MTKISHSTARLLLAKQRQMTSLIDQEIASQSSDMVFTKADWVPLYYDRGYAVQSDCGQMTAYRAVTLKGEYLWMVFSPTRTRGYHASATDPVEAMEQAQQSWSERRTVRSNWVEVEQTAKDLITGRQKFDVTIEDVYASPLCSLGIEGFREAFFIKRFNRVPGRLIALLMKVEPQLGFVIHEAKLRQGALDADVPASSIGVTQV